MRGSVSATVLLLPAANAVLQTRTEQIEFWPELQFRYRIDEANSAILESRLRATTGPAQLYRAEEILTFDHRFADWLSAGGRFEHRNSTNATPFDEERILLDQTLRVALPNAFRVDFRTQEEFRWLLSGFRFTPYGYAEVFWDSRYSTFARYRRAGGATLPVYRALSAQPYFMREVNFEGSLITRDVFGLALITSF